jgi:hypothetical protein
MATTQYRHEPLDESKEEIRLLLLDPFDRDRETEIANQPLQCRIKRRSLSLHVGWNADTDAELKYHAVSYSWGKVKGTVPICVDGMLLEVPKCAENVIRSLYRCSGGITGQAGVWIDAICIDQDNLQEKGRQVAMMDLIFEHAAMVHVWLGPSDDSTAAAISSVRAIVEERLEEETEDVRCLTNYATKVGTHVLERYLELPLPDGCNWSALVGFFSSGWFTRLWVVQEAVLARNAICHCGPLNIPLDDVILAAYCLESKRRGLQYIRADEDAGRRGIYNAAQVYALRKTLTPPRLVDLLKLCPRFQTTDLRDKVFGLLGMSDMWRASRHNKMLDPDYTETNSIETVYKNATRAALEEDESLRLLQDAQALVQSEESPETKEQLELPSWVPRFHFVRDPDQGALVSIKPQDACNGERLCLRSFQGDVLRLEGMLCDEVARVTEVMDISLFANQGALRDHIQKLWDIAQEGVSHATPNVSTAFRAVLLGGSDPEKRLRDPGPSQPCPSQLCPSQPCPSQSCPTTETYSCVPGLVRRIWRFMSDLRWPRSGIRLTNPGIQEMEEQTEIDGQALQMDPEFASSMIDKRNEWRIQGYEGLSDEQWQAYLDELMNMSVNRVFFITKEGRMGLGPANTQMGDKVCILCGGQVPFLLREGEIYWKLVGDAYVDGVMKVSFVPGSSLWSDTDKVKGDFFDRRGGPFACRPFDIL